MYKETSFQAFYVENSSWKPVAFRRLMKTFILANPTQQERSTCWFYQYNVIIYIIIRDELTVTHQSRKNGEVTKSQNHTITWLSCKDVPNLVLNRKATTTRWLPR